MLLIDGHNLIPKLSGLSLSDPDDEAQLIQLLQEYCRLRRKRVEVYFDQAPAGQSGDKRFGSVHAVFVRSGRTADEAIQDRLSQLGKKAKNTQVVSSDRQVQQAARAAHAPVITSEAFAADWERLSAEVPQMDSRNRLLSEAELNAWEQLFRKGHPPENGDQ